MERGDRSGSMKRHIPYLLSKAEMAVLQHRVDVLSVPKTHIASLATFYVQNKHIGYMKPSLAHVMLEKFPEIFVPMSKSTTSLAFTLSEEVDGLSLQEKTARVHDCHLKLKDNGFVRGWRDEMLPVSTHYKGDPVLLIERAMYPHYGIKAYGIHVNGFIRDKNTSEITHIWVGRRSRTKATSPGMLDHIVAGAQPYGISLADNVIKECEEEANIPAELAAKAKPVGAVTYNGIDDEGNLRRDILFCYDLELPLDFIPRPRDNEVESFQLQPTEWVLQKLVYRSDDEYKPNCNPVLIDFFIR
jgi:8-oxo-dGTP pyrophosphatase MutT (NUDIX family)